MRRDHVEPDLVTYSTLVKGYSLAADVNRGFKVVEELTTCHGFRPNIQVYTCLIQACLNNRRLDLAMSAHDRMASDASCKPDQKAYSVLVRGCLQSNGLDEAL